MTDSAMDVPDPRVLEETLAEGRRVLEISMTRVEQEFRRTERIQALAIGMLAATVGVVGIPDQTEGLAGPLASRIVFSSAAALNLVAALILGTALSGARRNLIPFGPDLGRLEGMLEEPEWDLTAFRMALLRVLNRDLRSNKEKERSLLIGRTRGLRLLYTSAVLHLLNLIFIVGGIFRV